ncbi:MAG TPA: hypothetical protein VKP30_30165, partial [Polyangiaceae bacterium]|nr:hypothetical protein [Polyangiaceae bacterium]
NRGILTPYESKDLEDIIALLDGAPELEPNILGQSDEVRTYIAEWSAQFVDNPRARDLAEGHLARGPLFDERLERVLERLRRLATTRP